MEVIKNIYQVVLPLPFKLDAINCYLLRGEDGWDIIDTGLNYTPARAGWENFFMLNNIKITDVQSIHLTHYHPGHYGLAGWLQELTGAPVFIHGVENAQVEQVWKKGRSNFPVVGDMFNEHGMPATLTAEVVEGMADVLKQILPHPELSCLKGEEQIKMGGRLFKVIHTPGHSDGHICFFCESEGVLISGDHLLSPKYSNVSLWPTSHPNPLELYLTSLEMVGCLPVNVVLPAHGAIFSDCAGRVDSLIKHHRQRLEAITTLAGAGNTAYQICTELFNSNLTLYELRFAMAETLSHLAYLESRCRVGSRQEGEVIVYKKL